MEIVNVNVCIGNGEWSLDEFGMGIDEWEIEIEMFFVNGHLQRNFQFPIVIFKVW